MPNRRLAALMTASALAASCAPSAPELAGPAGPALVPVPASLRVTEGAFTLAADARIGVRSAEGAPVAEQLARLLRRSTGYALPVVREPAEITLEVSGGQELGREGYTLDVTPAGVRLAAATAEGVFRGVQTLRQLLPAAIESSTPQPGPWTIGGVRIEDRPRFPYRGVMLDVARHFFTVEQVKRYIDLAVAYKVNVLHLHLTDDQGWRIEIRSWPELAGDDSYSQDDYREIVRYAAERFVTVVPEIDTPGHTNAALAAYAELNCDGVAREPYEGTEVGFSSLCVDKEITYRFLDDVVREVAALTPGPYLNLGGDEAHSTSPEDYEKFVARAQEIVDVHGKQLMGWAEITSGAVAQHWQPREPDRARAAVARGAKLVMSPADRAYLDMKYTDSTEYGLDWAGLVEVSDSYDWDPATVVEGIHEQDILGVEAPLWTETLATPDALEFMAYPRLPGIAEIGWSPATVRSWEDYRARLAAHGPRWSARSVTFYRSPEIPWS
ncbi:beta-N-acetylhexosaminidase [Nonomuraea africana]|uniref:beta-N-acetylhexosaminidase n=1 Tax=Nonomuraea africana TaxID=46171 RepID=A0ABR9KHQ3_9ACTN|nr:beta-N-acetylhexosaminidase [Nonomuraea africana]MBE1561543.1 hexosaminidase [Nonomuraea africana]